MSSPALGFSAEDERAVPTCAVTGRGGGGGGVHTLQTSARRHTLLWGPPFLRAQWGERGAVSWRKSCQRFNGRESSACREAGPSTRGAKAQRGGGPRRAGGSRRPGDPGGQGSPSGCRPMASCGVSAPACADVGAWVRLPEGWDGVDVGL